MIAALLLVAADKVVQVPPQPRNIVELSAGAGLSGRTFEYTDALTPNLRDYSIGRTAVAGVNGVVYPVGDAGIVGEYARALAPSSNGPAGEVPTHWQTWSAGPRYRFRIGGPELAAQITYGVFDFGFEESEPTAGQLTSVVYKQVRPGLELRVPFDRFELLVATGYRAVLGESFARLGTKRSGGIDAELGLSVLIAGPVSARLTGHYVRYFHAFGPVPGDPYVAGGALDQSYGGKLALVFKWGT